MKRNNVLSYSFISKTAISITDVSNVINVYTKTVNTNVDNYSSEYGIPFECVEFIRRFFATQCKYTFPPVVDAEDMFYTINALTHTSNQHTIALKTYTYPYGDEKDIFSYLKPGSILFWKYRKPDYIYGHVAFIWKNVPETNETYVVQQNLNPPIKIYKTDVLFSKMNSHASKFAGVKILPKQYLTGIQELECVVHRL